MKEDSWNKNIKINSNIKFIVIAVVLIVLFCVALTPKTLQNDTYYTIKIGEHIQNNGIDMKDPFSIHDNLNYTYPHWLYDLLTFKLYETFGFAGIYIVTCILTSVLGISIYFVGCKLSKNNIIPFFVTMGAMYLIEGYITARAQLVTFILFILEIFFIEKFIQNRKIRYGLGLVLIGILIANLHCAVWPFMFVLFMPYIAEYIIALLGDIIIYKKLKVFNLKRKIKKIKDVSKKEKLTKQLEDLQAKIEKIKIKRTKNLKDPYKIKIEKNKNVKWLIIIMIICMFTGLLTPIGDAPYTYLIKTMEGTTTQNINEHLPMTIANQPVVLVAIIIILSIMTFTKAKIKLNDLFMIGGLTILMLWTRRQLSMFSIIGSVVLCRLIVSCIEVYDKEMLKKITIGMAKTIPIIIICILSLLLSYDKFKYRKYEHYINNGTYPVKACDYILKNIDLKKARIYNEYNYGSYMIFRGIPVFIDSRADLYDPKFSGLDYSIFSDFINVSSIGTYYEDIFEKYNFTHILIPANTKIKMLIDKSKDKNYKKLYSDSSFVIYERLNAN